MKFAIKGTAAMGAAFLLGTTSLMAQTLPSQQEMWRIIQQQQREIEALKNGQRKTEKVTEQTKKVAEQNKQGLEATSDALKKVDASGSGEDGWWKRTKIGGYGELHYNAGNKDEIDFHRFVLFFGHDFNDHIRLVSEFEIEHAVTKDSADGSGVGEVVLEQAYLEFDLYGKMLSAQAGAFLVPVGILNETHEPPTFYGVERNNVETNIIPTTWTEAGVNATARFGQGFAASFGVHSGLDVPETGSNAFKVRNGRQKVAKATFTDPALTGRLKWTGIPGLELSGTVSYQFDVTQSATLKNTAAILYEGHAIYTYRGVSLRALYARWDLDGTAPEAIGRDVQYGWYVEPSYRFKLSERFGDLGFFARYAQWDNSAGSSSSRSKEAQFTVGANYWPIDDVVLKADYQYQDFEDNTGEDQRINLGIGYQF